ncbi:MAG: hypothetical protein LBE59_04815, partial [Nevskiaceae bacterium]|nr:hypothetical protein [Nevskiaceae bacterium]
MAHRILVALVCLLGLLTAQGAWAEVGRTPGNFAVTPQGSATYTIPIFTPPGVNGLTPSLALTYNSASGVGYVGRGWSLAGLSAIQRCNKTIAQDGAASAVQLQVEDGYCLNGQRLLHAAGPYGQDGSTYQTEIADFSLITAHNSAGNGPEFFSVKTKDGLTYYYGATADSRVLATGQNTAHTWYLSQISDRSGNNIVFTYKMPDATTTGATHPVKIQWAATSSGAGDYINSIEFEYGANVPTSSTYAFIADTAVRDTDLLQTILVRSSGAVTRRYTLSYNTSPTTGGKRLDTVTECSDPSGTNCLAPTVIGYQDGEGGILTSSSTIFSSATTGSGIGDFNGDGFDDLLFHSGSALYVSFGGATALSAAVSIGATVAVASVGWTFGDVRGDGQDVILVPQNGVWVSYTWNGSGFASATAGVAVDSTIQSGLLDVDADGRADLVSVNTISMIIARLSTSTAGAVSFTPSATTIYDASGYQNLWVIFPSSGGARERFDFNGDGRSDLWFTSKALGDCYENFFGDTVCTSLYYSVYALVSPATPGAFTAISLAGGTATISGPQVPVFRTANLNDDACTDFLFDNAVRLSGCKGSTVASVTIPGNIVTALDWDGDGRRDVLSNDGGPNLSVNLSTGEGFASPVSTSLPNNGAWLAADFNGDGLDDLGNRTLSSISYRLHNGATIIPDLATSFADGFGVTASVSYSSLTTAVYTPGIGTGFPVSVVRGALKDGEGMQVVSTVAATDGVGGTYTTGYSYFGGYEDLHGRGFLGFDQVTITDSRNGMSQVDLYERTFPKTGALKQTTVYQSGGMPVSEQVFTLEERDLSLLGGSFSKFVHVSNIKTKQYEVGGPANGQMILETSTSLTYDNYGNVTESIHTVTDRDAASLDPEQSWKQTQTTSYFNDASGHWCLGLPESITQQYTATGATDITRTQAPVVDALNCRISGMIIEPGSSTRRVDSRFEFDSFGNIKSTTVTGRDSNAEAMPERISSTDWGTTGRFPLTQTDAMGLVNIYTYNEPTGQIATHTDPSGIVQVTNTFDTFQRLQRSTRADGTHTVYSYTLCGVSAVHACENGDKISDLTAINKLVVVADQRDKNEGLISQQLTYLDQFDRPIVQKGQTLSDDYSRVGRQYDALGRVWRESAPCTDSACNQYWTTNTFDPVGRVIEQTRPESQLNETPVRTVIVYDRLMQSITDGEGKLSIQRQDANGRLRRSQDHDGYYQDFFYDAAGSLIQVSDTAKDILFSASYSYGIQAFQDATTDMDLGTWQYRYNSLSERTGWTDAKGQSFSQTYDSISRPLTRSGPNLLAQWHWDGDESTPFTKGRLAGMSSSVPAYSETYRYDSAGRRVAEAIVSNGVLYTYDYEYDPITGQLSKLLYPTSTLNKRVTVAYGYQHGQLASVQDATPGNPVTVFWQATAQNARGQITTDRLGNGIVRNRAFDAVTGWQANVQAGLGGGASVLNQSYAYDRVGNVTQRQDGNAGLTENFYYDNLHRLDYSTLNDVENLNVDYHPTGNIKSRSDVGGGAEWTYDPTKKHAVTQAGGNGYAYDANGNMTRRAGANISWTSDNYPSSVPVPGGTAALTYNGNRELIRRQIPHPSGAMETTVYVGELVERRILNGIHDWRHYIKVNGQTVAIVSRQSNGAKAITYTLGDVQGSPAVFANSSGEAVLSESFDAFGRPRNATTWSGALSSAEQISVSDLSDRGYTGHTMLGYGGLIHMRGRVQDSITGRFLSPDPNIPDPGFTQSYNRYAYV